MSCLLARKGRTRACWSRSTFCKGKIKIAIGTWSQRWRRSWQKLKNRFWDLFKSHCRIIRIKSIWSFGTKSRRSMTLRKIKGIFSKYCRIVKNMSLPSPTSNYGKAINIQLSTRAPSAQNTGFTNKATKYNVWIADSTFSRPQTYNPKLHSLTAD